jgi:hypothetical protein
VVNLVEHILRRLAEHAREFASLPTVTVPSAAVSDDDTQAWSDHRYMSELVDTFLDAAGQGDAHIACPLVESMLARPTIDDQGVDFDWRDEAAEQLCAWRIQLDGDREWAYWWLAEQRHNARLVAS